MTAIQLFVTNRDGGERVLTVETGQSLMLAVRNAGMDLEGACDGAMACCTCHVVIDPMWADKLLPRQIEESDTLALASNITRHSRLACQIMLTEALEGLRFRLP